MMTIRPSPGTELPSRYERMASSSKPGTSTAFLPMMSESQPTTGVDTMPTASNKPKCRFRTNVVISNSPNDIENSEGMDNSIENGLPSRAMPRSFMKIMKKVMSPRNAMPLMPPTNATTHRVGLRRTRFVACIWMPGSLAPSSSPVLPMFLNAQ